MESIHKYTNTKKDSNEIRPQQRNQTKKGFSSQLFFYKYKHKCTNENTHKYANTEIQKDLNGIRPQQGNQTKKCFPINFLRDSDGSRRCPQNPGTWSKYLGFLFDNYFLLIGQIHWVICTNTFCKWIYIVWSKYFSFHLTNTFCFNGKN